MSEVKYDEDGKFRAQDGKVYTKAQVEKVLALRAQGLGTPTIDVKVFGSEREDMKGWLSWNILKTIPGAFGKATRAKKAVETPKDRKRRLDRERGARKRAEAKKAAAAPAAE